MTLDGMIAYLLALSVPIWLVAEQCVSWWSSARQRQRPESGHRRLSSAGAAPAMRPREVNASGRAA